MATVHLATLSLVISTWVGAATANVFSEPAIFERLSHFKDYGVPGTVDDPLNQAMIADASCRNFDNYDGFTFYHNQTAVTEVIAALASLPPTGEPSHFTLTARNVIPPACGPSTSTAPTARKCNTLPLASLTGSMDNWHRALCAPNGDPSWGSTYDPAYQPQQVALTVGFMCIVACDCAETDLPATALAEFASSKANAKQANAALCKSAPYGIVNFTAQATTPALLTEASAPIREVCGCAATSTTAASGGHPQSAQNQTWAIALSVAGGLALVSGIVVYTTHKRRVAAFSKLTNHDDALAAYSDDN